MMTSQKIGPALSVIFALAANQAGAYGLTSAEINANEIRQIAEEIRSGNIDSVVTSAPKCMQGGELRGSALIVSTPVVVGGVDVLLETVVMPRRVYSQARTLGEAKLPPVDLQPLESALRDRATGELEKLLKKCSDRRQSAKVIDPHPMVRNILMRTATHSRQRQPSAQMAMARVGRWTIQPAACRRREFLTAHANQPSGVHRDSRTDQIKPNPT